MWKSKRNKKPVPKYVKRKYAPSEKTASSDLYAVQRNILRQAGLAFLTIILTIVILFAMTSAWYTNIVQTSGLVFSAESWGFEGEITVNRDPIPASPGDHGLVQLNVQNGSDQISAVSINVTKDLMEKPMQKRMFFYVDTPMTRNDETMDRVYINELESYTYTLFNNGKLTLTDKIHNAPQLKWQWVYDTLGYYVLAELYDVRSTDGTQMQYVSEKEYLRPIEYDFDKATFTTETDENGLQTYVLETVDGEKTPEDFLKELSQKDGYPKEIGEPVGNGYYPISVDENGYGIYAYLCTYAEIQEATKYDTELGELAYQAAHGASLTEEQTGKINYNADLIVSAQKNATVVATANNLSTLELAISKGTADVIQLNGNITIQPEGRSLQIPEDSKILLDLNGHSLISKLEGTAIAVDPGGSLTVINGKIIGPGADVKESYGIYATGAEVVMSKVEMSGFQNGFYLRDDLDKNEQDSHVYIVDCDIQSESSALIASGNGTLSDQPTELIIENSNLFGRVYGLSGNGDSSGSGRWGTDIQVINSTIGANSHTPSAGIYHPQKNSTLKLYKCTVDGYTGMAIKGGSVSIEDSKVDGKGGTHNEPEIATSGFTDTADAVYIETGYDYDIFLEVRGDSKFASTASGSQSLRVYEEGSPFVAVNLYSGTFDNNLLDAYIAPGSVKNGNTVVIAPESTEQTE